MVRQTPASPTLIILATPGWPLSPSGDGDAALRPALPDFQHIAQTLDLALDAGMPVVLAASRWVRQQCEVFAPEITCVDTDTLSLQAGQDQAWTRAIGQAVQACPQSSGWLIMPTPMPRLQVNTLLKLGAALASTSLLCPVFGAESGYPIGFSAEFFSELVRLGHGGDLRRLLSRYPLTPVPTDDPGVLPPSATGVGQWAHLPPSPARTPGSQH